MVLYECYQGIGRPVAFEQQIRATLEHRQSLIPRSPHVVVVRVAPASDKFGVHTICPHAIHSYDVLVHNENEVHLDFLMIS